jgi:hypothetical protein
MPERHCPEIGCKQLDGHLGYHDPTEAADESVPTTKSPKTRNPAPAGDNQE